ncbi:hypothetical protein HK101_011847 [Irineochytrium annulatum]|nr:hypothetical protein HK101_011847 [Irineochytrium annulatum]
MGTRILRGGQVPIVSSLLSYKYRSFVDLNTIASARSAALTMTRFVPASEFRKADDEFRDRTSRSDEISFLHRTDALHPSFTRILDLLDGVKADVGTGMHLNGVSEYQVAIYRRPGAHYVRHRDAFPVDDRGDMEQRRLTAIVYLTEANATGGGLKLYRPLKSDGVVLDTPPGRLILFLSGVVDHEVLPIVSENRVAITSWSR